MTEQDESQYWCYSESSPFTFEGLGDEAWQTGCPLCGDNCLLKASPEEIKECESYFDNQ